MKTQETILHLSPADLAMLQFYETHENQPPTWLELSRRYLPKWVRLTLLGVAACALVEYGGADGFTRAVLLFYAGYWFGVMLKDVLEMHKLLATWPVLDFIIDWSRIHGLQRERKATGQRPLSSLTVSI